LRSVQPLVSLVHLPVSLAGPRPSGSSGPFRRCHGCLPPIPVRLDGVGCPQLARACCDRLAAMVSHHRTAPERIVRSIPLHPQSRLGNRRPRPAAVTLPPSALGLRGPPPRRPRGPLIAISFSCATSAGAYCRLSGPPARRSSRRTPAPSPVTPPPVSRRPPGTSTRDTRPSCDRTPQALPRRAASRPLIRLCQWPSVSPVSSHASEPRHRCQTRTRLSGDQERASREIRGRTRGVLAGAYGRNFMATVTRDSSSRPRGTEAQASRPRIGPRVPMNCRSPGRAGRHLEDKPAAGGHRRGGYAGERVEAVLVEMLEHVERCATSGSHAHPAGLGIGV
jgi:hypothetical protein